MKQSIFVLAACALLTAPIFAQGRKTVDCFCTDRGGNRVELGENICLSVDGRMFTAQCQMSLNVPMWREVEQGCLSSMMQNDLSTQAQNNDSYQQH